MAIYLKEAHAQDVWPLGQHYCINDHKSLSDRVAGANKFSEKYKFQIPFWIDGMEDEYLYTYLAHPERFYAFYDMKLMFKAQPIEATYPLFQLRDWLQAHFAQHPRKS